MACHQLSSPLLIHVVADALTVGYREWLRDGTVAGMLTFSSDGHLYLPQAESLLLCHTTQAICQTEQGEVAPCSSSPCCPRGRPMQEATSMMARAELEEQGIAGDTVHILIGGSEWMSISCASLKKLTSDSCVEY